MAIVGAAHKRSKTGVQMTDKRSLWRDFVRKFHRDHRAESFLTPEFAARLSAEWAEAKQTGVAMQVVATGTSPQLPEDNSSEDESQ